MLANLPDLWTKENSHTQNKNESSVDVAKRDSRKAFQKQVLERMKKQQANFAKSADDFYQSY